MSLSFVSVDPLNIEKFLGKQIRVITVDTEFNSHVITGWEWMIFKGILLNPKKTIDKTFSRYSSISTTNGSISDVIVSDDNKTDWIIKINDVYLYFGEPVVECLYKQSEKNSNYQLAMYLIDKLSTRTETK